jgi:hypothetical protein
MNFSYLCVSSKLFLWASTGENERKGFLFLNHNLQKETRINNRSGSVSGCEEEQKKEFFLNHNLQEETGTASHYIGPVGRGRARTGAKRRKKKFFPESQSSGKNENHQFIGSVGGAREDKRTTESFPSKK